MSASPFPLEAVRKCFPSLASDYMFVENAGGSQVLGSVAESIKDYLLNSNVQMAAYDLAYKAAERIEQGHAAAALFAGAESTDQVMNGASATQLAETLSKMIEETLLKQRRGEYKGEEPEWKEGDEIIISQADHETNRGAWLRLAARQQLTIKEWKVSPIAKQSDSNPYAVELSLSELEKLVTPRTRLVAFTACSNVLGGFTPVKEAAALIKKQSQGNAWVAIDAVAFAPHKQVTPQEWGIDFCFFSWYKIYSAHTASLYICPRATKELLTKLNHHFLHEKPGSYPYQPSSQQYELIAATARVVEYLSWIGKASSKGPAPVAWKEAFGSQSGGGGVYGAKSTNGGSGVHGAPGDASASRAQLRSDLERSFAAISAHEQALLDVLLDFLTSKEMRERGVRIVGNERADSSLRAPTVAFVVQGKGHTKSAELQQRIVRNGKLGVQQGHMYAYALVEGLGLSIDDGVVRVSFVHYNSVEEVKKVCALIEEAVRSL